MTEEQKKNRLEQGPEKKEGKQPHLIDVGGVAEVAQWVSPIILGLATSAIYDLSKGALRTTLAGVKRRFGKTRVREIEARVTELIGDVKTQSDIDDNEINARMDEIFSDFH